LAPGAGVAPTPAASKAVELLLFDPGMVGRQGLAPWPHGLKGRCSADRARDPENWSLQP